MDHATKEAIRLAKLNLLKKYPHATLSKFEFYVNVSTDNKIKGVDIYFRNSDIISTDITSTTFKNDKNMWKWLHNTSKFPKIWSSDGTVPKLLLTETLKYYDGTTTFPSYVLNYPTHNFDIFVDNNNSFKSNLPKISIDTKLWYGPDGNDYTTRWTLSKSYYQAISGMYIATYKSGVSLQNLSYHDDVPKQITSLMRFHVYFTIRRIMFRMSKSEKDINDILRLYLSDWRLLKKHAPLTDVYIPHIKDLQGDYRRYCPISSNGFTELGQQLLNQSIEAYMYAILGAQAKSKQSIVGTKASAKETQQVFRNLVEDAVVRYSPSLWINLMNKAITTTNVKLDTAVTPNTWLIPRSMVLLKNPIAGYNNSLRTSTGSHLRFGYNSGLNYQDPNPIPKVHQESGEHLRSLHTTVSKHTKPIAHTTASKHTKPNDYTTPIVLGASAVSGYLLTKYVLK